MPVTAVVSQADVAACLRVEGSCGWPACVVPRWQRHQRRREAEGGVHGICAQSGGSAAAPKVPESSAACDLPRRSLLAAAAAAAALVAAPGPSAATRLPEALDRAWEGLGGGPSDLVFPGGLSAHQS